MSRQFIVSLPKTIASGLTSLASLIITIGMIWRSHYAAAVLFGIIFIIFLLTMIRYCSVVEVDKKGIRRIMLGQVIRSYDWKEIREIGVCGLKVFGNTSKKAGPLNIYVSPRQMTENELFQMILKWPPKDEIYLEYTKEALSEIQLRYTGKVKRYNTGEFRPYDTFDPEDFKIKQ